MAFEDFGKLIERGLPTKDILASIKSRADAIYAAEHPAVVEPEIPNRDTLCRACNSPSERETTEAVRFTYAGLSHHRNADEPEKWVSAFLKGKRHFL